ncbi:hypothetical protein H6F89_08980 [Cyanobacteria bacterium FACHB-63]|nr:hypothetical protein [Cyanobacteria bacterium FACHB-63]MBD1843527.1 hypothetical protein [Cyanobacteria bacterium FACHB-63]
MLKWGDSIFSSLALNDDWLPVQMAALSPRNHPAERGVEVDISPSIGGF